MITATPLLLVGGGGAAGASEIGGPGGFGITPQAVPTSALSFLRVTSDTLYYTPVNIGYYKQVFNDGSTSLIQFPSALTIQTIASIYGILIQFADSRGNLINIRNMKTK